MSGPMRGRRGPKPDRECEEVRAEFSPCGRYRYFLCRYWDAGLRPMRIVMFNPSTADSYFDDPTVQRCTQIAKAWGWGGLYVYNLFAVVSTDPSEVRRLGRDAVGPENDEQLRAALRCGYPIVCGWGALPRQQASGWRVREFAQMVQECGTKLVAIAKTPTMAPQHPLYVKVAPAALPFSLESFL